MSLYKQFVLTIDNIQSCIGWESKEVFVLFSIV